jgi:hypothetical protein
LLGFFGFLIGLEAEEPQMKNADPGSSRRRSAFEGEMRAVLVVYASRRGGSYLAYSGALAQPSVTARNHRRKLAFPRLNVLQRSEYRDLFCGSLYMVDPLVDTRQHELDGRERSKNT